MKICEQLDLLSTSGDIIIKEISSFVLLQLDRLKQGLEVAGPKSLQ